MKKRLWNHYCVPNEIYPYLRAVMVCMWYESTFWPDSWKEGFAEINSTVPNDVYPLLLEKAKELYLEKTGDETYGNWDEKKDVIDRYYHYLQNSDLSDEKETVYSCPVTFLPYVEDILKRCYYTCETMVSEDDHTAIFRSNITEKNYPFVIERAKMEYLSHIHNGVLYVSPAEDSDRNGWVTYMRMYYWHTHFYFIPGSNDYALLEQEGDKQ